MNSRIEDTIDEARKPSAAWDPSQTSRGLSSDIARSKVHAVRERLAQRVLVAATISALVAVALLRAGSALVALGTPKPSVPTPPQTLAAEPAVHLLQDDDGGVGERWSTERMEGAIGRAPHSEAATTMHATGDAHF
ncbi:hypothetical protein [Pendulispora albinea]|uniref:Uncharacterized protein n=1 Tax=Pendulispora albinea TaxID=2741071 RepID=A0ABZ2LZZ1_9BACT